MVFGREKNRTLHLLCHLYLCVTMIVFSISLNDTVQLDISIAAFEKVACGELWFIVTYSSPPIFGG